MKAFQGDRILYVDQSDKRENGRVVSCIFARDF